MNHAARTAIIAAIGATGGIAVLAALSTARAANALRPGTPAPQPSQPNIAGPGRLTTDPIPVNPGGRYLAVVDVSAPLSWLASTAKVRAEAERRGFRDVVVTDRPPRPGLAEGDYYVEGTYQGSPSTVARSNGPVTIRDAWRVA